MRIFLVFLLICTSFEVSADEKIGKLKDDLSVFSGRVSKISGKSSLMRVRVDFVNFKFLNKKDKVEFWLESYPSHRCIAYVIGKSNEYMLLRIPSFSQCVRKVGVTVGSYLHFRSKDLSRTLQIAEELLQVLLKKRLALHSRLSRTKKDLDAHIEKVDAVNRRYEVLRDKLDLEHQQEMMALEDDRTSKFKVYKDTQAKLDSLDYKLEQYRIGDHNLKLDRWSLDPKLYRRK
jgi:hypothetical protein